MEKEKGLHFETLAIHAGVEPEPVTGAIMTPIFATSTFIQTSPGKHKGYDYARTDNPTRTVLQHSIAALEGAKFCLATGSGCAAADILLHMLQLGDHVLSVDDVYGGISRLFRTIHSHHGVTASFVDMNQDSILKHATEKTKMIWVETPTNPLLKIIDIERVVEDARKLNPRPLVIVDNTFASPYFQNPLKFGADVVLHSTTKYLNGHSDVIGGALVFNSDELHTRLHHIQNSIGAVPGPFDAWLVLRGIKTLALRMKRHEENAIEIAEYLERHPAVERVIYPGLKSHPSHEIARKQMKGFGGMVTFLLKGDLGHARKFLENIRVFSLAESLGGVESLVDHPAIMTHASLPSEMRRQLGISDSLVRLSVGVENIQDLKSDLDFALSR